MTRQEAIKKVLNELRAHLGLGENPPGSNHNLITEWYNKNVRRIGNGAWCQMTDTFSVWKAGFKELLEGEAYTVYAAQNAQKRLKGSSWHFGTKGMRAGDQVYYDWTGRKGPDAIKYIDHTGTVEKINGDGTFYALEGNVSDKLQRVKRDGKFVVGYVRLAYNRVTNEKPKNHNPVEKKTTSPHHDSVPAGEHGVDNSVAGRIKDIQRAVGMTGHAVDGKWGPKTDHEILTFRKKHLIR